MAILHAMGTTFSHFCVFDYYTCMNLSSKNNVSKKKNTSVKMKAVKKHIYLDFRPHNFFHGDNDIIWVTFQRFLERPARAVRDSQICCPRMSITSHDE